MTPLTLSRSRTHRSPHLCRGSLGSYRREAGERRPASCGSSSSSCRSSSSRSSRRSSPGSSTSSPSRKGGGRRILGAAVIAVGILYVFSCSSPRAKSARAPDLTPADREPRARAVQVDRRSGRASQARSRSSSPPTTRRRTSTHVLATLPDDVLRPPHGADRGRRRLGRRHGRTFPRRAALRRSSSRSTAARARLCVRLPTRARHRGERGRDDGRRRTAPGE